jgi:hypothetical protein
MIINNSAEQQRLNINADKDVPLEKWGPYLSERQWGTVREDYSVFGDAWNYFPHEHARSRTYLWGEDGLAGITDYNQNICFALALWNGHDPILKERLFGLANGQGNHGEDVKELYYYLDNVPSHYYMKYLYKYPHAAFPYQDILTKSAELSMQEPEYEILDTGVFNDNKYFDIFIEYAKKTSDDIVVKIEIINRSVEAADLTVLPTLWFYNRWQYDSFDVKPCITRNGKNSVLASHERSGDYYLYFQGADESWFTENETNFKKLFGTENKTPFVKDAFHEAIIDKKNLRALRRNNSGTKFSPVYKKNVAGNSTWTIYLRLSNEKTDNPFHTGFEEIFNQRKLEADDFYNHLLVPDKELANIERQAFAGLLWNKQYYHYDVERWLDSSDGITEIGTGRATGRNNHWKNLKNKDVISMPDKWEYPWYAAWDSAFHAISMAMVDPVFAKNQLILLMREWYMNPQGQLPAYEWDFSDLNPPVHAFAVLEVYKTEQRICGKSDINFLKKAFQKLIINFTWWVNRKDRNGNNIFEGGFLGLDNISIFNRNMPMNSDATLEQTDGTSWMGMYALNMLDIALEIAIHDKSFEDTATKFYEHFVLIAEALNELGLWDDEDNFFYDVLSITDKLPFHLKIRSIIGITPFFAVSVVGSEKLEQLKDFQKRMSWFRNYRAVNKKYLPGHESSEERDMLFSLVKKDRMIEMLQRFLDESEFLSKGGIRSISKFYETKPYSISIGGVVYTIQYDPGDATSDMYGGNSNWRGPVWMPINYLFIRALNKYGSFYGDTVKAEFPTGSGKYLNLKEIANELTERVISIFTVDAENNRPVFGKYNWFYKEEKNDLILFHEYFHGETSGGLGASHQTGWTALLVNLVRL